MPGKSSDTLTLVKKRRFYKNVPIWNVFYFASTKNSSRIYVNILNSSIHQRNRRIFLFFDDVQYTYDTLWYHMIPYIFFEPGGPLLIAIKISIIACPKHMSSSLGRVV